MKFLQRNIGIITIAILQFWMAFLNFKSPEETNEKMYLFYLSTGGILFVLLAMIYFKHYRRKSD